MTEQPKHPGGRPSDYSEELAAAICERLANGEPLAKICRDPDMPGYSTVRRWEDEKPEFQALSLRARIDGTHFLADDSMRIADDDGIDTQRAKLMIDTRLRLIGKWNAKQYGDKITQEHTGPNGGPMQTETKLDVAGLSEATLRELAGLRVTGEK